MFKLNFKIALRNLWKNKTASVINIFGLAIGLTACLLLLLYVSYQWSFDKQWKGADEIYQVMTNFKDTNAEISGTGNSTGNRVGPVLLENYPGVKAMTRLEDEGDKLIGNGTNSFKKKARFADADILNIFDYTFLAGDQKTALNSPNSVIVTESMAKMLFGTTDVLNKAIRFDNKTDLKITGVIKDLPVNSSVYFDYLMPWTLYEALNAWIKVPAWTNYSWKTLVKLDPATDVAQFNKGIEGLLKQNERSSHEAHFLFPLSKLHLYGSFIKGKSVGGNIEQLRLFMGLAIGVLLIACINFMNMATAKSEKRAKEVGIKKTLGASRGSLISQFLTESLLLTISSAILAIILVELCLPRFNTLLDLEINVIYSNGYVWLGLIAVVLLTGFIAGSYPAFYLSSFNPIQVLRKRRNNYGISFRQVLVVIQFSFAVILIISTSVIYKQIQYIKNRPIGYEINKLVEMPQDGELSGKFELLKDRLIKSGAVTSMYQSSSSISRDGSNSWNLEWPGMDEAGKQVAFNQIATTYGFIETTGVKLIAGRDFSANFASDSVAVMINQTAAKRMNMSKPVGQVIVYHGVKSTIVGVFEDFIWGSPFQSEQPMLVAFNKGWSGNITMRLNDANSVSSNIAVIEKIAKEINPAYPTEVKFVDQLYAEKLKSQKVLGILSNLFGGLAIFISCMGLFGLSAYSAEQRTKEIGVRKVLGASVGNLIGLLTVSFLKLVVIAIGIAIPVADYFMDKWLMKFEFHVSVSWLLIAAAAVGTLVIAIVTVSFQAYKAARTNPVNALKYE